MSVRAWSLSADAFSGRVGVSAAEDCPVQAPLCRRYSTCDYEDDSSGVLFAETVPNAVVRQASERTMRGLKARRFAMEGMLETDGSTVVNPERGDMSIRKPSRRAIYMDKQLYPPIHDREIVRIMQRKFRL